MSAYSTSRASEYNPTPLEIAEACALIRAGWSIREHYARAGLLPPGWTNHLECHEQRGNSDLWTAPIVKAGCAQ